jgi:cytochrome c peroxidase
MRTVNRLFALAALAGCGTPASRPPPDDAAAGERAQLARLSPLGPVPPDPTNAYADDPDAARLGQMLFFDPDLSGPLVVDSPLGRAGERGKVSCRTCHGGPALDDQDSVPNHVSIGTGVGGRNSPPILNSAFYVWTNWGGRFDSQWSLVLGAIENPEVMNGARRDVARTVVAKYRAEYDAVFPPLDPAVDLGAPDTAAVVDRVFANTGKAVAAYLRTLVARDAPFDRYAAGDAGAISAAARRGFRVFLDHCERCHGGPHFQDDRFHALGVAQFGPGVPATDLGRFTDVVPLLASPFNTAGPHSDGPSKLAGLAQAANHRGQFRTPSLRNVAVTAPYMHAGQFATLEAVVAFYNAGGGREVDGITRSAELERLDLTAEQQADLVELLRTLTDTAIPAERLIDTSR